MFETDEENEAVDELEKEIHQQKIDVTLDKEFFEMDHRLTYIEKKEPPQWRKEKPILSNPLGKNKRSVWTVPVKPYQEAHFATYPPDLIEPCILAGSPLGGQVIDPFGGAGTTGLVAKKHNRNAILIELNEQYADISKARLLVEA